MKIKKDFGLRCLVDKSTGEIVIFDETYPSSGIYHRHVRKWNYLNLMEKKVNSMKYMEPKYCSFTLDTVENCCNLILNIVLYSVDRDIAEKIVLDNLDSSIDELKYTSIISVGHIVRIDKRISLDIINKLELLKNSGQFLGAISDVFDDINLFCDK